MQANPDKSQAIMFRNSGFENGKRLDICGSWIQCEETVKLLGVTFDYMLNFETHIANVSKRAARQRNVLFRLRLKRTIFLHIYFGTVYFTIKSQRFGWLKPFWRELSSFSATPSSCQYCQPFWIQMLLRYILYKISYIWILIIAHKCGIV